MGRARNGSGSGFSCSRDRRFWRRIKEGEGTSEIRPLRAASAGNTEARVNGAVFREGAGRNSNGETDMGFEMSPWKSFGNFRRHVLQTFREGRETKGKKGEWRYMATLARSQQGMLTASLVTLVLAAMCEVAVPHFSSRALNAAVFAQDRTLFGRSLVGMLAYSLLAAVFTGFRGACFWLAGTHVVAKVRFDLLSSLLRQDISFHDVNETGALTSRLASDTAKISNVVSFHVNILCRQVIQAVGGLGYLFYLQRRLAAVAFGGLVAVGAVTAIYGVFSRRISAKVQTALAEAGSVAEQSLSLVKVVRAHANEDHERRRYGDKIGDSVELQETQGIAYGMARIVIGWSQAVLLTGVLMLGAGMVFDGQMTGQALTTFIFYTNFVTAASFDVGDQIQEALGAGQEVFELLKRKSSVRKETLSAHSATPPQVIEAHLGATPRIGDSSEEGDSSVISPPLETTPSNGVEVCERGRVDFRSVSFGYPTRSGVLILDKLSFTARQGETVAVVGSSGSGKSTILRLLCRFYDPDGGVVTLAGRDLSTYGARDISNTISWVTQEPQLFPISVKENIAYGLPEGSYSMDDVYEAAKNANIHSFIYGLPDGYDTLVGEGGASLSGGQKQRVAIARALIRDPEVLLLDEPTSALDVESEKLVQDALDRAGQGRTVILVAHRLATIQRADRILVMQDGAVVESGSHTDLLSLGGVYAELYKHGEQVAAI
eukprot:jgi/Undpi1/14270/HiC_scaffold_9.g03919.m1